MRRTATRPASTYSDPNDVRLSSVIRSGQGPERGAVNMLGIPFDGGVLGRKGAAGGPGGIREALRFFSNFDPERRVWLGRARVVDLGDLLIARQGIVAAHRSVEREVRDVLREGSLTVILGGDNSLSLPSLRACAKTFGKIGLVTVDSHLDLRGKINGKPTSGSSYGLAIRSIPSLDPRRVTEIGIHGFLNSRDYFEKARKLGVSVVTPSQLRKAGAARVAKDAYGVAAEGADCVYLSVDLDAVDLSEVSGVSAPSVGGISASELSEIAFQISAKEKTKCADIVELAPSLDPTGKSQIVAATCLVSMIAGFTSRQR